MNCIIPGLNLKVLSKALLALGKVGDDIFIEAHKEKLSLITLNLRKTICVRYYFLDSFFSSYEVNETEFNEEREAVTCKIHMKTLFPLFKGPHLEKKLDFIKIEYESNSDFIIFKMKFKCDDILMTHRLRLMESETLSIGITADAGSNDLLAPSSFFNQLLATFSSSDYEITWEVSKDKMVVRNYIVGAPVSSNHVRTQVNLNASEFSMFRVKKETAINFSLKPLKTAIQFAECFNLNMGVNFEVGGKPLALITKNPTFEVNYIVATLNPYSDLQSSMAATSIPAKITQANPDPANLTLEDQQALLNENWDEEMEVESVKAKADENSKKRKECADGTENDTKKGKKSKNSHKTFDLPGSDPVPMDVGDEADVIPPSPESPRTKKAKVVFGRCIERTFCEEYLGEVLAPNSDSE